MQSTKVNCIAKLNDMQAYINQLKADNAMLHEKVSQLELTVASHESRISSLESELLIMKNVQISKYNEVDTQLSIPINVGEITYNSDEDNDDFHTPLSSLSESDESDDETDEQELKLQENFNEESPYQMYLTGMLEAMISNSYADNKYYASNEVRKAINSEFDDMINDIRVIDTLTNTKDDVFSSLNSNTLFYQVDKVIDDKFQYTNDLTVIPIKKALYPTYYITPDNDVFRKVSKLTCECGCYIGEELDMQEHEESELHINSLLNMMNEIEPEEPEEPEESEQKFYESNYQYWLRTNVPLSPGEFYNMAYKFFPGMKMEDAYRMLGMDVPLHLIIANEEEDDYDDIDIDFDNDDDLTLPAMACPDISEPVKPQTPVKRVIGKPSKNGLSKRH
jgi:hypothetical protein